MQKPFAMGLKILTIRFLCKVVIFQEYREHQGNRQSQKQRHGFSTVFLSETCGKFEVCYSICVLNLDFFAYLVAINRFRCGWFRMLLHDRTCTDCYWLSTIYNANSFRSAHLYLFFKWRKFNIKRRCRVQHHACFRYSICI